jgi:NADH:ubiquinone oxidoreductase subunit F (NADH-binding)
MTPDELIQTVIDSGLIGRGGAAFPTGLKWKYTRQNQETTRYLVCNADESEPGTFKDRVLMEQYPHLLLEGIAIAAYAIGATRAYLFIRGEYPHPQQVLQAALDQAIADQVPFPCPIEIRRGAGAYICGAL